MGSTWLTHKTQILRETGDLAVILYKIFKYSSRLNVISAKMAKEMRLPWWNQFVENLDDVLKKVTNMLSIMTSLNGDGLLKKMIDAGMKNEDLVRIIADLIIAAGDTVITLVYLCNFYHTTSDAYRAFKRISEISPDQTKISSIILYV